MARFSLSLFTVFLVLAAFAFALPTKRDGSQKRDTSDGAMDSLSVRFKPPAHRQVLILIRFSIQPVADLIKDLGISTQPLSSSASAPSPTSTPSSAPRKQAASEPVKQGRKAFKSAVGEPTKTSKEPSTGNFVTSTAEQTPAHHIVKPNSLGKLPIVGQVLGGGGIL